MDVGGCSEDDRSKFDPLLKERLRTEPLRDVLGLIIGTSFFILEKIFIYD